jgi:hypothetical protein
MEYIHICCLDDSMWKRIMEWWLCRIKGRLYVETNCLLKDNDREVLLLYFNYYRCLIFRYV